MAKWNNPTWIKTKYNGFYPIYDVSTDWIDSLRQEQEYQEDVEQFPLFHWRETCRPLHKWVDVDIDTPWTLPF